MTEGDIELIFGSGNVQICDLLTYLKCIIFLMILCQMSTLLSLLYVETSCNTGYSVYVGTVT